MKKSRIMYIEFKGEGLVGPARIGCVTFLKSGRTLYYRGRTFQSLKGGGAGKSNYFEVETGEEYWISGCREDGRDALYNTDVEIDEDVRVEYWSTIRKHPEHATTEAYRARGKVS